MFNFDKGNCLKMDKLGAWERFLMNKVFKLILFGVLAISLVACGKDNSNHEKTEGVQNETIQPTQAADGTSLNFSVNKFFSSFNGKIDHIHGLGYAGNQDAIFFAAHDGLKVFENGKWYKTTKENNDYMGFNAVKSGFYTSGHPGEDSKLPNPIGIMKSEDNGETLINLAYEGEVDFHAMGVGYENNFIFVMSPHKNSKMDGNKYYFSEDDAKSWEEVRAKGLGNEIMSIAVHPTKPETIAVAGKEGIYLSVDKGDNFKLITEGKQGTAVFLTEDDLYYGAYDGNALLVKRSLADGSEEEIALPEMKQDAVMYLAQNPINGNEVIFSTFNGDIYQTQDGMKTWNLIVKEGKIQ